MGMYFFSIIIFFLGLFFFNRVIYLIKKNTFFPTPHLYPRWWIKYPPVHSQKSNNVIKTSWISSLVNKSSSWSVDGNNITFFWYTMICMRNSSCQNVFSHLNLVFKGYFMFLARSSSDLSPRLTADSMLYFFQIKPQWWKTLSCIQSCI